MPRAIGQVTTSSASKVPINATTYNEPTSGAQRSLKSSSANDTAAGTGVRSVKITYWKYNTVTGAITGPFVETVAMAGTVAAPTSGTEICFIEKLEAASVGSGGVAAGTITLFAAADGTGTQIAQIATGATQTFLGHHYVASGKQTRITDLECLGGDAAAAQVEIDVKPFPSGPELALTGKYGTTSTLPRGVQFSDSPHAPISGPARVRAQVTPANTNAQTTTASFGFVDQQVSFG